ncbi:MAG: hypothetical protein AAB069_02680 [Planctomycetota bacterium]
MPQQLAHQLLVAHAISFNHVPIEHQRRILLQNQRSQRLIGQHDFRETAAVQIRLQFMAKEALIIGAMRHNLDTPERQILPEREREHFPGDTAAPQRRGKVAREQARRGPGDEHLHVFRVTEAAYPPLPAGHILNLVKKEKFVLPYRFRKYLVPAAQHHIQVLCLDGMQPVILEIQIHNPPTLHPLSRQPPDGVEEQKCFAGPSNASQTNNFTCAGRENQFPWLAGRQYPFNELTDNVFQIITIHRDNIQ